MRPIMTNKEIAAVVLEADAGKKIQFRNLCDPDDYPWTVAAHPCWNFEDCEYRVAPEPLEFWSAVYGPLDKPVQVCIRPNWNEEQTRKAWKGATIVLLRQVID